VSWCALVGCGEAAVVEVRHPHRPEDVTALCRRHGRRAEKVGAEVVTGRCRA
jgi:hypothetical protein